MYRIITNILKVILKMRGAFIIVNKENLPKNPGYIIACTHRGWVDVVALGAAILPEQIHFMAKKELFRNALFSRFLTAINAFPVDRKNPGTSSIKIPIQLLKSGKNVGIFPSGTRTSEEAPLKRGAVTIAKMGKVPIVPAAYSGPTNLKELFTNKKIKIIIGNPLIFEYENNNRHEIDDNTTRLSEVFRALEKSIN
ncbi:lysophospholipid acyltransferase family protein [Bacillus canaveralius]|uniref:lysophospholipid acyltransferase family protein n=1 Tax=Bacillus canaveralius TaxID=1403243 RepID=UPI000F7AB12D|nr:lysophospholipid acyltransferase family protein [Bacillus canaveralius]RSK55313.1 1-acyl-sn-glycerol-3-phosphate acyltransferase [Bacillus canaveralius]